MPPLGLSTQPPAASRASPKRVRAETPTRGTRRASERTPVKEESAAKSRRAVEAVTSSDVTSSEVDAVTSRFAISNDGIECEHGRRRWACPDCHPCPFTTGKLVGKRRRKDKCSDCNPCVCTRGRPPGKRVRKDNCHPCNACDCPVCISNLDLMDRPRKNQCPHGGSGEPFAQEPSKGTPGVRSDEQEE